VIISIKNSQKYLDSGKAALTAGELTIAFLLVGENFN